jgi:hypothetical protein
MSEWEKIIYELVKNPIEVVEETDIIYKEYPKNKLNARIYRNESKAKQPILIDIHGGAWNVGSRFGGVYYDRQLALAGFKVAAIDFRHAPEYQHPSATEDIETAIEYFRTNSEEIDGDVSVMDMHYLIAERGEKVKHFVDRHELGLFEIDKTLEIMRTVGFKAWYLPDGLMKNRGLYIGKKNKNQ